MTLLWYAAYGSNTNESRFAEYLDRCRQATAPLDSRPFVIDLPLYFAGTTSARWGDGGVAFVGADRDPVPTTLARAWRLPRELFDEIKALEGERYDVSRECGVLDGLPVVTFTASVRRTPDNPPSRPYANVVARGLRETHGLTPEAVAAYLSPRTRLPVATLMKWQAAEEARPRSNG